jgi:hypothetical protein
MPSGGIRGAGFVWEIKTTKYQIDSLNGYFIAFGITFMFMVNGNVDKN